MAPRGRWALTAAGVVVVLATVVWAVPRLLYPPLPASRIMVGEDAAESPP
jgi:hypothetical protein